MEKIDKIKNSDAPKAECRIKSLFELDAEAIKRIK